MKIDDGICFNLETKKLPGAVKIHDGSHDNPFSHSGLETDCFYENTVWRVGYWKKSSIYKYCNIVPSETIKYSQENSHVVNF